MVEFYKSESEDELEDGEDKEWQPSMVPSRAASDVDSGDEVHEPSLAPPRAASDVDSGDEVHEPSMAPPRAPSDVDSGDEVHEPSKAPPRAASDVDSGDEDHKLTHLVETVAETEAPKCFVDEQMAVDGDARTLPNGTASSPEHRNHVTAARDEKMSRSNDGHSDNNEHCTHSDLSNDTNTENPDLMHPCVPKSLDHPLLDQDIQPKKIDILASESDQDVRNINDDADSSFELHQQHTMDLVSESKIINGDHIPNEPTMASLEDDDDFLPNLGDDQSIAKSLEYANKIEQLKDSVGADDDMEHLVLLDDDDEVENNNANPNVSSVPVSHGVAGNDSAAAAIEKEQAILAALPPRLSMLVTKLGMIPSLPRVSFAHIA